jgi:hypothetical protein
MTPALATGEVLIVQRNGGVKRAFKRPPCVPMDRNRAFRMCIPVADRFEVSVAEMLSRARPSRIAWPRQIAMYLMRLEQWSFVDIGAFFGRHHGTAIYAFYTVQSQIAIYPLAAKQVIALQNALNIQTT